MSDDPTKHDVRLAPALGPGQLEMEAEHVSSLLAELIDESGNKWAEIWDDAIRHERAYHGFGCDSARENDKAELGLPSKNLIRLLVSGYNSRLQQDHAEHKAYPMHPQAGDVKSAELANRFLDWFRRDQEFTVREYEFGQNGQLHGTAFWKVYWDVQEGEELFQPAFDKDGIPKIDADGQQEVESLGFEGKVAADIFTVFDACYGPGHDVSKAEWCLFRNFVSKEQALAMLHEAGLSEDHLPAAQDYQSVSDGEAIGFAVWEVWYKPGFRFPKGLFAKVLGKSVVLHSGQFPYLHKQLPIAVWHPDFVRDRPFGTSHVFDNYSLQRKLNLAESKKDELMNRMAGVLMTAPEDLIDEIEEGNLIVKVNDQTQANMIQFKSLQNIPSLITDRSAELQRDMFDIGGQNEILAGFESLKSGTSAKSYEFLNRSDQMKMAGSIARHRASSYRRDRQALKLFQQFATVERKVLVIGEDQQAYVEVFNGARLDGTDVVMEPILGADNLRSTKAGAAPESAQLGLLNPADVPEVSVTGLGSSLGAGQGADKIRQLVANGGEPDPAVPPLIALAELQLLGAAGMDPATIATFEAFYRQQLAAAAQPAPEGAPQ